MPWFASLFPKLLVVIGKDASKSVASYVTKQAINHVRFRKFIIRLGQFENSILMRDKMEKMGFLKPKITPLNEQQAIEKGSEIFEYIVGFTLVTFLIVFTYGVWPTKPHKNEALLKEINDLKDEIDLLKVKDRERNLQIKQLNDKIDRYIDDHRSKHDSKLSSTTDSKGAPVSSAKNRSVILDRSDILGVEFRLDEAKSYTLKSPMHNSRESRTFLCSNSIRNDLPRNPRDIIGRSADAVAFDLFNKSNETNYTTILPLMLFTSVLIFYLCD